MIVVILIFSVSRRVAEYVSLELFCSVSWSVYSSQSEMCSNAPKQGGGGGGCGWGGGGVRTHGRSLPPVCVLT